MTPRATVIIPTFEDWDGLQICLDCLAAQTAEPTVFEVIVANNNPTADVPPSLRLPPNARVIHAEKPGSYAARNAAIAEARGNVLFFTDSDCLPDPRWIEAGLEAIAKLRPIDLVAGGITMFPAGDRWTATELYDRVHHLLQEEYATRGWCATANLVARREAFDHVGLFDDSRFAGADKVWTLRATTMGVHLKFDPDVLVRHPARAGFAAMAKKRRRQIGGKHHSEEAGEISRRAVARYATLVTAKKVKRTMFHPDLTDVERLKVLGIDLLLGMVVLGEVIRLRYLSGRASRS